MVSPVTPSLIVLVLPLLFAPRYATPLLITLKVLTLFQVQQKQTQPQQTQPQQPQQVQQPQQTPMPAQTPAPLQQQQQQQIRTPTTQGVTIQPYSNPTANTQPQQQQNPFSELLQIRGEMISALNKLNNFLNAHGANSNQ